MNNNDVMSAPMHVRYPGSLCFEGRCEQCDEVRDTLAVTGERRVNERDNDAQAEEDLYVLLEQVGPTLRGHLRSAINRVRAIEHLRGGRAAKETE